MVRYSNARDRQKIQSEYRQRFGIRWGTVVRDQDVDQYQVLFIAIKMSKLVWFSKSIVLVTILFYHLKTRQNVKNNLDFGWLFLVKMKIIQSLDCFSGFLIILATHLTGSHLVLISNGSRF
jgi:hypothetical protein